MNEHTLKFFGEELAQLKAEVARMGGLVEAQVSDAVAAVAERDVGLSQTVIGRDEKIDALQRDIEKKAIRMIALRQPVAQDLRRTVGAMKLSLNLERAGDYAKNIAKRALVIAESDPMTPLTRSVERMGKLVVLRWTPIPRAI
jgi:phosphate transport system protein